MKYFLILGIVLSSLVYNPLATEPFLLYKELFFRLFVLCATLIFIFHCLYKVNFARLKESVSSSLPLLCFIGYIFVYYQSAINFHELVSEQVRLTYLYIFFLIASSVNWQRSDLTFFAWLLSVSACLVSVIGILEMFYIYPLYGIKERMLSLFGYPNLVAQFVMLGLVIEFVFFFLLRKPIERSVNGLLFLLNGVCLFLTYCRSSWLAVVVSLSSVFLMWAKVRVKNDKRKLLAFATFTAILLFLCMLLSIRDYYVKQVRIGSEYAKGGEIYLNKEIQGLKETLSRARSQESGDQASLSLQDRAWHMTKLSKLARRGDNQRFHLWKTTIEMIKKFPLFGVGAGHFYIYYPKFSSGEDKLQFVKWAHNDYFHFTSEYGFLGLFLIVWWFYAMIVRTHFVLKIAGKKESYLLFTALVGLLVAIAVDAFFSYDWYMTVPSIFLWFVLGVFQSCYYSSAIQQNESLEGTEKSGIFLKPLFFVIVAFIIIAFVQLRDIHSQVKAHSAFGESQKELGAGRLDQAINYLEQSVTLQRGEPRYHFVLANLYLQLRKPDRALIEFEKTLKLTPYAFVTNFLTGITYYLNHNFDDSIKILNDLSQKYKTDLYLRSQLLEILNEYGNILYENKQYDEAKNNYELIIRADPTISAAYFNLGNVYFQEQALERALQYYDAAFRIDPTQYPLLMKLGLTHQLMGRYDQAISFYELAAEVSKKDYQLFLNMGIAFSEIGKKNKAREFLKKSIALAPDQPQSELILNLIKSL